MKYQIFVFAFLTLAGLTKASARFTVGNGGDAILCRKSTDNKLEGSYSLDYIVTLKDIQGEDGLAAVKSWANSAERIYNLLLVKAPTLAPYFQDFRENVFNTDYSKSKVWEPTPFGLIEIDDQNITSLIPENCKTDGKTQLTQAVIREFQSYSGAERDHVIYKYDPAIVSSLDQQSPLQLSFLMVHEWLWDLSQNVDRNRRINRFLHSKEIETMAPEVVISNLKGMGLVIPSLQADVFDDRSCQGEMMKAQDFDEYYPQRFITGNWGELKVERRQRRMSCPGGLNSCDMTWKNPGWMDDIYGKFRYYVGPIWSDNKREDPIKILSPDYIKSQNMFFLPGSEQFSCHITDDPKENLECKINEPNFFYSLFGQSDESHTKWKDVVLKGVLTTECLRLKVSGRYPETYMDISGHSYQDSVQETVFYIHAKDGVFLKPRE